MNKQTKRLYKKQVSVKFHKGVDFAHQGTKRDMVEMSFVSFPFGSQPRKKFKQGRS